MRATLLAGLLGLCVSACAQPSPEVRSSNWENDAILLTEPATNY